MSQKQGLISAKTQTERRISIGKCIKAVVLLCLIYVLCTGVLPFLQHKPVSDAFAAFVSVSDFYADTPCVDRVALVEYPSDSFDTRIHILDEAVERIDVSYYAMHMGETTDLFLGALLDAADRGVHVRIIVDGQFGGLTRYHSKYATALGAHPNIELKVYNAPNVWKPWTWNGRLHDKYIIIDEKLLLLGGRNIGDKYFAPEEYTKQLSYDRDVLIYNTAWQGEDTDSVLYAVRDYMDSLWDSDAVSQPFQADTKPGAKKRQAIQADYFQFRSAHSSLFDHSNDDYEAWTYPANRVTFFHNDTQIGLKEPKVGYILEKLLLNAENSVVLQSPYVILDPMLKDVLSEIGNKQINARVLTNSVASSPNPIACTAYWGDRSTILRTGISVWEYQGNHSIHAKSYLIDNRLTVVGSYNLDPRSAYLDTELMLAIDSPEFATHFEQVQAGYFQQSLELSDSNGNTTETDTSARLISVVKRIVMVVLYLPVKLFKYLT